jgi:hypothetical protein
LVTQTQEEQAVKVKTLFAYIDESGNFDFNHTGTKHLVMAVFCTTDPASNSFALAKLKYEIMGQGIDLANFHASEDLQRVRDQVFEVIYQSPMASAKTFWISKTEHTLTKPEASESYKIFGKPIALHLGEIVLETKANKVVVVFDKALVRQDQNAFLASIKPHLAAMKLPYHVYFHSVSKDFNGQIADYIAWSNYVALERNEYRPVASLPSNLSLASEIKSKP